MSFHLGGTNYSVDFGLYHRLTFLFVGRFSSCASKGLKFHSWPNYFTTSKAPCGGLFSMLLTTKKQIIEQVQSLLGYLGRNKSIFIDKETSSKQVKYWQASSRSCFYCLVWIFQFIIIFIWFGTEPIGLGFALNLILGSWSV